MIIVQTGMMGGEWITVAQDRDRWRAVVNTVINVVGFHVWLTVHRNSVWIRKTQLDVTLYSLFLF